MPFLSFDSIPLCSHIPFPAILPGTNYNPTFEHHRNSFFLTANFISFIIPLMNVTSTSFPLLAFGQTIQHIRHSTAGSSSLCFSLSIWRAGTRCTIAGQLETENPIFLDHSAKSLPSLNSTNPFFLLLNYLPLKSLALYKSSSQLISPLWIFASSHLDLHSSQA